MARVPEVPRWTAGMAHARPRNDGLVLPWVKSPVVALRIGRIIVMASAGVNRKVIDPHFSGEYAAADREYLLACDLLGDRRASRGGVLRRSSGHEGDARASRSRSCARVRRRGGRRAPGAGRHGRGAATGGVRSSRHRCGAPRGHHAARLRRTRGRTNAVSRSRMSRHPSPARTRHRGAPRPTRRASRRADETESRRRCRSAGGSMGPPRPLPGLGAALRTVEPGIGWRARRGCGRGGSLRRRRAGRLGTGVGRAVIGRARNRRVTLVISCVTVVIAWAGQGCGREGHAVRADDGAPASAQGSSPTPPAAPSVRTNAAAQELPTGPLVTPVVVSILLPSGSRVRAELADTPERRRTGLMFRDALAPDGGMLLAFPEDDFHGIWMKNCRIALDLLWLDAGGGVVDVVEAAPPCSADPCDSYQPHQPARSVLELPAGTARREGLARGSRLQVLAVPPIRPTSQ